MEVIRLNRIVGVMIGSVILKNCLAGDAPSGLPLHIDLWEYF